MANQKSERNCVRPHTILKEFRHKLSSKNVEPAELIGSENESLDGRPDGLALFGNFNFKVLN